MEILTDFYSNFNWNDILGWPFTPIGLVSFYFWRTIGRKIQMDIASLHSMLEIYFI